MSRKAVIDSTANLVDADSAAVRTGLFHSGRAVQVNTPGCQPDELVDLAEFIVVDDPTWPEMTVTVADTGSS